MTAPHVEYEQFVRDIFETLLRAQGVETVKVEHDVQVQGISRPHQVDVYWEFRLAGVLHSVIINCKRYASTVEVGDVEQMKGVLSDVPDARGMLVTTVGYQQGAVDFARIHRIGLKVIRPPEDADWQGRLREARLRIRVVSPIVLDADVQLDKEWIAANLSSAERASLLGPFHGDGQQIWIEDRTAGRRVTMADLFRQVPTANVPHGTPLTHRFDWEDAMLESPGFPRAKIRALIFKYEIHDGLTVLSSVRFDDARAIVRDAIAGTLLFIQEDGIVKGDTEAEGIPRPSRP
jgi:hypothetical protein